MTLKQHTDDITTKAKQLNILRSLTHTTFGHSKEDITTMYKQYIRQILTYTHTAWQPDTAAKTNINKLQSTQTTAIWIATGCTKSTPLPHLHEETQVIPLTSHMDMRGTHIYTSAVDPQPSYTSGDHLVSGAQDGQKYIVLLERSRQTVLQLIPKHWGSAANRNPP